MTSTTPAVIDVRTGTFSATVELAPGESLTIGRDGAEANSTHRITVPADALPPVPPIPVQSMRIVLYPDPDSAPKLLATMATNNTGSWALRSGLRMVKSFGWIELFGGDTLELMRLNPPPQSHSSVFAAQIVGDYPHRVLPTAPPTTIDPQEWAWRELILSLRARLFSSQPGSGAAAWRKEGLALLVDLVADEYSGTRRGVFHTAMTRWSGSPDGWQTLEKASWVLGRCKDAWAESIPADWTELLAFDEIIGALPSERAMKALAQRLRGWGVISETHLEMTRAMIAKGATE